jgi:hypothetical protein
MGDLQKIPINAWFHAVRLQVDVRRLKHLDGKR